MVTFDKVLPGGGARKESKVAERVIRQLVDDIDGTDISDGGRTVEFSFRGIDYRLDLSEENLSEFEHAIRPYIDAAERASNSDESFAAPASRGNAAPAARKKVSKGDGRRSGRSSSKAPSAAKRSRTTRQVKAATPFSKEQLAHVRAWANENGHQVSARGRISREVIEAFEAAQDS